MQCFSPVQCEQRAAANGRRRIAPAGGFGPNVLSRPSRRALFTGRPRCCAAPQRRTRVMGTTSRRHFESALLGCIAALTCTAAGAQDAPFELPTIGVTSTRLGAPAPRTPARERAPVATRAPTPTPAPTTDVSTGDVTVELPSGIVTGTTITGASTTIITSTDIERSPGQTIQDVLAREPGIQVRSLFGDVNGAQTVVDHARLRRHRVQQHARADQRTTDQRSRRHRRRSQHHPAREHRSHRDHPRQQRRGAVR